MRTRAEQKAATRARLLDAAALLVASKGVDGATVDAIAAGAGVTTGALYASFRTKADLLRALVTERRHEVPELPLQQLAVDVGERWAAALEEDPVGARLTLEMLTAGGRDDVLRGVMATAVSANVEALAGRLADERVPLRLEAHDAALLVQVLAAGWALLHEVLGDALPSSLMTSAVDLMRGER